MNINPLNMVIQILGSKDLYLKYRSQLFRAGNGMLARGGPVPYRYR